MNDDQKLESFFDSTPDSGLYEYKLSFEKLKRELSKFGLTSNQINVYVYLGKYGSKAAPEICKALKIPRTETYHLLTALQNRGIVIATFQHPIKFSALPLDKAVWSLLNAEQERVNNLQLQEKDIKELWDAIPKFDTNSDTKETKFQTLQGTNQIYSKIKEMMKDIKNEFFILGSEKDFMKFYHSNLIETLDQSNITLKLLTSCSKKSMYVFDDIDRSKVKKMTEDIKENLCFLIKDDKELLFFIKNATQSIHQMTALWTDSASMIYSMKMLFDSMWSKSKNIHL
ncbi:MAG: TrmB family transcriptional regulator [Thaumarchaeota archaeon]|nr:TrmB family transcriptional regulator [Nitrososphaerota archaeon]MBI3641159.1 TrmB family transcriptional regulator [Nitrososphaerota archaeon]